jgi:NAD(P)-dependent dehydrogenase (short-subunit alcohol dehydrogenase family)
LEASGRKILVTGASSGIGRATAVELARRGAELLLVGRTPERCAAALAEIRAAGGDKPELVRGDFGSLAGIRQLADEIRDRTDRLDVLVNNAGVTLTRRQVTEDGFERTFAVNHLGYFALTGHLLPLLRAGRDARIVNVASEGHRFGRLDFDDLQNELRYRMLRVYGQSKCANVLWNTELARRLEGSGITANCLHPGGIRSNLGAGNGVLLDFVQRAVGRIFLKSPEQGARTSVYLATSPEVAGVSGRYFAKCRQKRPSAHATDPEAARRLWELSEEMVGFSYP